MRKSQLCRSGGGTSQRLALVFVALAGASIRFGAMAAADPIWPVAGNGSAADTIRDLQNQGYTVAINGSVTAPLERCLVTAIHNSDRSGGTPDQSTTVYVDVFCPSDRDS